MNSEPNIKTTDEYLGNASASGGYAQITLPDENATEMSVNGSLRFSRLRARSFDSPENRVLMRSVWKKAVAAAENLKRSCDSDRSEMFLCTVNLKDATDQLWELRSLRDENWVGILDQIRTSIETLAENGIETITPEQCWKLLQLVDTYLSPSTKAPEDLKAAVQLVVEMNLNPYSGLEPLASS